MILSVFSLGRQCTQDSNFAPFLSKNEKDLRLSYLQLTCKLFSQKNHTNSKKRCNLSKVHLQWCEQKVQPVINCGLLKNSVHAYCMYLIMVIAHKIWNGTKSARQELRDFEAAYSHRLKFIQKIYFKTKNHKTFLLMNH